MADTIYRAFAPELEIQSRAKGGDGRTIVGIAVPYDHAQAIPSEGIVESFARGVFSAQIRAPYRIPFARDHLPTGGILIGRTMLLKDDAAGLYGEWRVSNTPMGEETLELVRDQALTDLSIGFRSGSNRRLDSGVLERVTATLREVAVVLEGAYGEAAMVGAVRAADEPSKLDQAKQILAGLPKVKVDDAK